MKFKFVCHDLLLLLFIFIISLYNVCKCYETQDLKMTALYCISDTSLVNFYS